MRLALILLLGCRGAVHVASVSVPQQRPRPIDPVEDALITVDPDPGVTPPRSLDFADDVIDPVPPERDPAADEARAMLRDANRCLRPDDVLVHGALWIEVTIDPAGRPIHVTSGGFGERAPCVVMAARNRRYRALRGTVRIALP